MNKIDFDNNYILGFLHFLIENVGFLGLKSKKIY